jgi:hypothetical protein
MPSFNVTFNHDLSRREAVRRIKMLIDHLERRYAGRFALEKAWEDNGLRFRLSRGTTDVSGRMTVGARTLCVTATLPWSLAPFAAILRQQFEREARRLLIG